MNGVGQRPRTGFAQEQMNVLRHDNVAIHAQRKLLTGPLKGLQKQLAYSGAIQPRLPSIATEGYKMRLPRVMQSYQPLRHANHFTERAWTWEGKSENLQRWTASLPTLAAKTAAKVGHPHPAAPIRVQPLERSLVPHVRAAGGPFKPSGLSGVAV